MDIFDQKNINFFSALNFFQFLVIKTLDPELDPDTDPHPNPHPDPQLEKMLDPDWYPDPH
jgi:hypothetical protein